MVRFQWNFRFLKLQKPPLHAWNEPFNIPHFQSVANCNQLKFIKNTFQSVLVTGITCNHLKYIASCWNSSSSKLPTASNDVSVDMQNTLFSHVIETELYITWQSSDPMFKEVTWQKFEATIWFKNDLTFWAFDREINQTRIPDPWDHLNIHNESEMNYHEYSDSVHRHVIRLPRDHFSITWP